jgi:hypothetical protein
VVLGKGLIWIHQNDDVQLPRPVHSQHQLHGNIRRAAGPLMIITLAVSRKASNPSRGSVASQVFRSTRTWLGRADRASLDFFRLDHNGKVAEHWAVLQRTPEVSTNKNTMF